MANVEQRIPPADKTELSWMWPGKCWKLPTGSAHIEIGHGRIPGGCKLLHQRGSGKWNCLCGNEENLGGGARKGWIKARSRRNQMKRFTKQKKKKVNCPTAGGLAIGAGRKPSGSEDASFSACLEWIICTTKPGHETRAFCASYSANYPQLRGVHEKRFPITRQREGQRTLTRKRLELRGGSNPSICHPHPLLAGN